MNDKPIRQQTFLQGTAVLAMATVLVKLMGFLFKVPLNNIIGDTGFGYFNTAYDVYNVLLMISTTGLPVAMSRMISEAKTLGNFAQIRRIYKTSLAAFLTMGGHRGAGAVRAAHLPGVGLPRLLPGAERYDAHVGQPDL